MDGRQPGPHGTPTRTERRVPPASTLTPALADHFARVALGHVVREYPNHLSHALAGPADAQTPRALHPAFYGSYDWHSAVHAHWLLAHLLQEYPASPHAPAIRALFDAHLTPGAIAAECGYFDRPLGRGFERPYGWAWVLKLAEALHRLPEPRWSAAVRPLAMLIAGRLAGFLPGSPYPVRTGTHFNTAFALRLAADYADVLDPALTPLLEAAARRWYGGDEACQAWEPSADDFLSPALIEAECMRRLLPAAEFLPWFGRFLPQLAEGRPETLFRLPVVSDRSDGKTAHLDGLSLSRAWCFRGLAAALAPGDARVSVMQEAAAVHLDAALPHVAGDYMGEHWLASFAVLALASPSPPG